MDISGFQFIESMLSSPTPEAESAVIAFAKHFATHPLNSETVLVYQKLILYNNPEAIDALFKKRNPYSFFSIIEPSRSLILFAFSTLTEYRSGELYEPAVLACLGIIQNAYNDTNVSSNSDAGLAAKGTIFGDGSELAGDSTTSATSGVIGMVYYKITEGMLDNLIDTTEANSVPSSKVIDGVSVSDANLNAELAHNNVKNTNSSANDKRYITDAYDATAYAAMDKKRTVAIAVSEDLMAQSINVMAYSGSATLSNFKVVNNVKVNDNAQEIASVDTIQFDVDDIEKLQADAGKILDFTGIKDLDGNAATQDSAKAIIQDKMPPLMTKATWDGQALTLTFNEDVKEVNATEIGYEVDGVMKTYTIDIYDNNTTFSANTITIAESAFSGMIPSFKGAKYAESSIYSVTEYVHGMLQFNDVQDIHANSWNNTSTPSEVSAPIFAAVDTLPNLDTISNIGISAKTYNAGDTLAFEFTMNQDVQGLYEINASAIGSGNLASYFDSVVSISDINGSKAADYFYIIDEGLNPIKASSVINQNQGDANISFDGAKISVSLEFNTTVNLGSGSSLNFKVNSKTTKLSDVKYNKGIAVKAN